MTDIKLTSQLVGKYCLQLILAEKATKEQSSYSRAVHQSTLEFAKYFHHKQVLEIIGADYLMEGLDKVKTKFNDNYYLNRCKKS
jgi:hypothetical protein